MNPNDGSPTQRVLDALAASGCHAIRSGTGWSARCPAHDDQSPSLSIAQGDDGRALVHCHAGCDVDDVVGAIGLRKTDLFSVACDTFRVADRVKPKSVACDHGDRSSPDSRPGPKSPMTYRDAQAAQAAVEAMIGSSVESRWEYHDPHGELIGLILRFELSDGKTIRPVSSNEEGWYLGGMPVPRPLYALREIIDSVGVVYVCEGEKASDAGRACGLVTTTSPHGAQSASKADWSVMHGREVIILPDHDDAGEQYAADVVELAHEAGAASVRIVRLADHWESIPNGGDLADVMAIEGGDVDAVCNGLQELVDASVMVPKVEEVELVDKSEEFIAFPLDAFPEPIRSYVIEGAGAIGCDPSFIALPMLSGLASAIGNTYLVQLKRSWTEPPIVWTAIVGESGTAKSPAIELALRFVRERQSRSMREYQEELTQWESEHAIWDAKQTKWKRDAANGKTTEAIPEPISPVCERTWTDDATIEALVGKLMENPRGLLMVRDELAGWFSFDRYSGGKGGSEVARWLELFGGRELIVDRKGSGTEYVPRASVSIAGGIQPELLRKSMTETNRENGLAARILYAMPPRTQKCWSDKDISSRTESLVSEVFDRLYALNADADQAYETDSKPKLITLDAHAKARWVRFVNDHGSEQMEMTGDEAAAWSKLEGYAARFAMIIHLTRLASGDASIGDPLILDLESLEAGITMVRWFAHETKRVYKRLMGTASEEYVRIKREHSKLIGWIQSKESQTTVRELMRGPSGYRSKDSAQAALDELVIAGLGEWKPGPGGRTRVFHLTG